MLTTTDDELMVEQVLHTYTHELNNISSSRCSADKRTIVLLLFSDL
jgi:hypothetical protein